MVRVCKFYTQWYSCERLINTVKHIHLPKTTLINYINYNINIIVDLTYHKNNMAFNEQYEWLKIEREYIQGIKTRNVETGEITITYPTHNDICEKYGMHLKTLQMRSSRDRWGMQRKQYQAKLKSKNNDVNFEDILGESAKFDAIVLQLNENVATLLLDKLKPYIEIIKANDEGDDNAISKYYDENDELTLPTLSVRDLKDIAATGKEIISTVRTILGEGTKDNLLDSIRDQIQLDYDNKRKQRILPKSHIRQQLKQMDEIEKQASELQLRREELQKMLDEKGSKRVDEQSE